MEKFVLLEFKAGRMIKNGNTVTADTRKGLIQILSDGALTHFTWKTRDIDAKNEVDRALIKNEVSFKKSSQAASRVYILHFTTDEKLYFWMQEPSTDKDEEYCTLINELINEAEGNAMEDIQSPSLKNQSPLNTNNYNTNSANNQPTGALRFDQFQQLLKSLPQYQPQEMGPNLSTIIDPDAILPILQSPYVQEKLLPYLPAEIRSTQELFEMIHSPQFLQTLETFGAALQGGQIDEMIRQFGLNPNIASTDRSGIEGFLEALQKSIQKPKDDMEEQ